MPRLPRLVLPYIPHHVTQRGFRKQRTFFKERDYSTYLELLAEAASKSSVEIWFYCLMPNHRHVIAVPSDERGLTQCFGQANRRYSKYLRGEERLTSKLWQSRFASVPMDEAHLYVALKYVALNPVRARMVKKPEDWPWSSTRALLERADNGIVTVAPVLERADDFAQFLGEDFDHDYGYNALRKAEGSNRPLGAKEWLIKQGFG